MILKPSYSFSELPPFLPALSMRWSAVAGRIARIGALVGAVTSIPACRVVLARDAAQRHARPLDVQVLVVPVQSAERLAEPRAQACGRYRQRPDACPEFRERAAELSSVGLTGHDSSPS